jgi:hypothetical protein
MVTSVWISSIQPMMSPYKTLNQTLQIKYIYILERVDAESF